MNITLPLTWFNLFCLVVVSTTLFFSPPPLLLLVMPGVVLLVSSHLMSHTFDLTKRKRRYIHAEHSHEAVIASNSIVFMLCCVCMYVRYQRVAMVWRRRNRKPNKKIHFFHLLWKLYLLQCVDEHHLRLCLWLCSGDNASAPYIHLMSTSP